MEEFERLREGGRLKEEAEQLSRRKNQLDADWHKLGLLLDEEIKREKLGTGGVASTERKSGEGAVDVEPTTGNGGEKALSQALEINEVDTPKPHLPPHEGWTIVHAHFIQMGGVAFEGANGSVWYKDFEEWKNDEIKAFFALRLTKEDIQDRSKADALSKAFVIVQCLWFVTQCIGRRASNLPLTELEVTCLAYIACNVGMYAFWWDKPLNVACPVVISTNEIPPKPEDPPTNVHIL